MNIHSLMSKFAELGGAKIGRGPKHPTSPNLTLASEIDAFLNDYSFLRRDQGYVDFLESYAGAWLMWPNDDLTIDIFGFTDVSTHIIGQEGLIVDNRGYLTICDGIVRVAPGDSLESVIGQGFAFDATGTRKWGIYRYVSQKEVATPYWYCETFLEALEALITTRGKLPDTLS